MILLSDLYSIGHVQKTHGIKGELSIVLSGDFEDLDFPCFIFEMDGIYVPFFAEEWRFKTSTTALLKLENINEEPQSRAFVGKSIFIGKESVPESEEQGVDMQFYTGYQMVDDTHGMVGTIQSIDDSTENLLFEVALNGNSHLIPVVDDWVISIDDDQKVLHVNLPEGLLDINDGDNKESIF